MFTNMLRAFTILLILSFICLSWEVHASFDRIRIVVTTSSDWTILWLTGNDCIVNTKGLPSLGSPKYNWGYDSLSVNQPLVDALEGKSVQVQFDVILESSDATMIAFESTKGNLGITRINFYQFNTSTPKLVASVENSNTSGHPNPKSFEVDAVLLLEGDIGLSQTQIPNLILAFYYPWYYLDSWKSPSLRDQPLVPYSSDNLSVISHHVHLAKQSGIDGFISSWWGPNNYTDKNLQKLLTVSEGMDFRVSIYFETLTGDPPHGRSESEILSWMRYFLKAYGNDKRFFMLEGKPVIFIWAAESVPLSTWSRIFEKLRSEVRDAIYIANTLNPDYLQVFDGLHDYGSAFRANIESDFRQASSAAKTYGWLENQPKQKIWAATAQPGYDERSLPDRRGAVIDRADGKTYSHTFEASIKSDPDWILITSFNEWWENTHIEPSKNYGNYYLELTARYADIYKGFQPRSPVNFYVPAISDPDGTVRLTWSNPLAQTPDSYNIYRSDQPFSSKTELIPLRTEVKGLSYSDLPSTDGEYYYAVTAIFGGTESALSEVIGTISSRSKSRADTNKEIPVDIAIYTDSVCWISEDEARRQAEALIQKVREKVNRIEIIRADALPDWVLSHIKNDQLDIIITFGDFPYSIYPSGNQQPDGSLAEAFLDDGNIFLNTADYAFYGRGRNGVDGLINIMDVSTTMWGDNTFVRRTKDGVEFTPSLRDFATDRPFHINELNGTDWEAEVSFADNGSNLADPVIVRNKKTGGRIGIIYQKADDALPRSQVISEIILNWLPKILKPPLWDINMDGKVDFNDLFIVGSNLGKNIKDPTPPNPDINRDGIVNIYDLVLVGLHFGENSQ